MAIAQNPYRFTNTMSIQRSTPSVTGGLTQSSHLSALFSQTLNDQFLYRQFIVRTFINENGDPEIERIDPMSIGMNVHEERLPDGSWREVNRTYIGDSNTNWPISQGSGLESQISQGSNYYHNTLTEQDIREFMTSMTTTSVGSNSTYEWQVLTGQQGYANFSEAMRGDERTIKFNDAEIDNSGNNIIYEKSGDYKIFELRVIKNEMNMRISTSNGTKREYDLLMKNAKRGIYLNTKNIKWIHEPK